MIDVEDAVQVIDLVLEAKSFQLAGIELDLFPVEVARLHDHTRRAFYVGGKVWHRQTRLLLGNGCALTLVIFGIPIGVSVSFVFLFVLFGSLLDKAGAGRYFLDLAFAMVGKYRGGPAKAAILASGMTGAISGSSIANVVTIQPDAHAGAKPDPLGEHRFDAAHPRGVVVLRPWH